MAQSPHEEQQRREHEQREREQQQRQAAKTKAPEPDPKLEERDREARAAASIGAQIILDYNSQAGLGARGGAAGSIEENTMLRDENLVALGLDPVSPSGPPPSPEELARRRAEEERRAREAAEPRHVTSQATKMSSLAAGIQNLPEPPPPAAASR